MGLLGLVKSAPAPREKAPALARLGLTTKAIDERDVLRTSARFGKDAVEESDDLARILALPRRPRPTHEEQRRMAEAMTKRLEKHPRPCACRINTLLPVQGWYLYEAANGGAIGHIIAGGGKTGIDILLPVAVEGVRRAVLLLPPQLRAQFFADFREWSEHFNVPNLAGGDTFVPGRPILDVLAFSELSHEKCAAWFRTVNPDTVIADEAQNLADVNATRTSRFLRHFIDSDGTQDVRFFPHSGTLTTKALAQYSHLIALALREGSPLPLESRTVREWGGAIDYSPKGVSAPIGALRKLCEVGETARAGFRRRLVETPGVITTEDAELPIKLYLHRRDPGIVPLHVRETLSQIRRTEERPDGEELVEAVEVKACLRQVAAGFYYFWRYPRGEPEELITKWFSRRKAWGQEMRAKLEGNRAPWLDSPGMLKRAAIRHVAFKAGETLTEEELELPRWDSHSWGQWSEIEKQVEPVQGVKWEDDYLVQDSIAWGREAPGVIWYLHSAFGERVAKLGGFELFEGGEDASERLLHVKGDKTIVCSIKAHGTGKNLQMFCRALVANLPSDGGVWEQLLARHHRTGQTNDVHTWVYQHTPELVQALEDAQEKARYVQETTGKAERLLYAIDLTRAA